MKVLFVCLGNICRSPTADAVLTSMAADREVKGLTVDSAGTAAYHVGSAPDPRAVSKGRSHGYDLSSLRARQVRDSDFDEFDLILAMDKANLADLKLRKPADCRARVEMASEFSSLDFQDVPDPYYGGDDGFEHVIRLCESIGEGVLAWYDGESTGA